ncbi:MAG: hypothetical protein PHE09_14180 [Oscillospiraceae bacterium]|nr:hypothetical protein [Oscillospiraceae bacterium]
MKYDALQRGIWMVFKGSFKRQLTETLREPFPAKVMKKAQRLSGNFIWSGRL